MFTIFGLVLYIFITNHYTYLSIMWHSVDLMQIFHVLHCIVSDWRFLCQCKSLTHCLWHSSLLDCVQCVHVRHLMACMSVITFITVYSPPLHLPGFQRAVDLLSVGTCVTRHALCCKVLTPEWCWWTWLVCGRLAGSDTWWRTMSITSTTSRGATRTSLTSTSTSTQVCQLEHL